MINLDGKKVFVSEEGGHWIDEQILLNCKIKKMILFSCGFIDVDTCENIEPAEAKTIPRDVVLNLSLSDNPETRTILCLYREEAINFYERHLKDPSAEKRILRLPVTTYFFGMQLVGICCTPSPQ